MLLFSVSSFLGDDAPGASIQRLANPTPVAIRAGGDESGMKRDPLNGYIAYRTIG
jgi:hypothetical protein